MGYGIYRVVEIRIGRGELIMSNNSSSNSNNDELIIFSQILRADFHSLSSYLFYLRFVFKINMQTYYNKLILIIFANF